MDVAWSEPSLAVAEVETPVGRLVVVAGPLGLLRIDLPGKDSTRVRAAEFPGKEHLRVMGPDARTSEAARQLGEYFAGSRRVFDLPLDPIGTDFDRLVWREVLAVPFGATTTYGAIARAIGRPKACRAVGAANGRNPLPIVVPCHRIVGAGGRLTGFGGGLPLKARLLEHEGVGSAAGRIAGAAPKGGCRQ